MPLDPTHEFKDMVVAVVGGNTGVGPAVVDAFAQRGAHVAVGSVPGAPAWQGTGAAWVREFDPFAVDGPAAFLDGCEQGLDPVEILIAVPPPVKTGGVLDLPPQRMREVIEVELLAPASLMQECARRMIARKTAGRIMAFISMSGKTGVHKHVAPYAAAKGGLVTFSRVLAAETAHTGVTVNLIATALFDVQLAGKTEEERAAITTGIPVGRAGRSEEAAHAALFLASRHAGYMTGETLSLSGGRFMD